MTEFSKGIYVQIKFNSFYHRDIKLRATDPTTTNIVGLIKLGLVACVLAVVCKRTPKLPTEI